MELEFRKKDGTFMVGFILNNVDEPSEIGVVNNFFLLLITFAYLIATLLGGFKKSTK